VAEPGPNEEILALDGVCLSDETGDVCLQAADLVVRSGEFAAVLMGDAEARVAFIDACLGLRTPDRGLIRYRGVDWRGMELSAANAARGSIGYALDAPDWIGTLTIAENVVLRALHHSRRAPSDILKEAARLAADIGLAELPQGAPAAMSQQQCRKVSLVRAFVGSPALILLERPTRGAALVKMSGLLRRLREARDGGSAVLWLTSEHHVWCDSALQPTARYRVFNTRLGRMR